jgi:hypothetical protein
MNNFATFPSTVPPSELSFPLATTTSVLGSTAEKYELGQNTSPDLQNQIGIGLLARDHHPVALKVRMLALG